jgi:GTP-binding protein
LNIRNIAVIAHVDHGKTTLIDGLLKQSGTFRENEKVETRLMDSNDLEKERGITITSKNTSINYKDNVINIIDTPGHADFGGEVERVLKMIDGVILVVDAFEGVMPQTKFVVSKAVKYGVKVILVINKIDKKNHRAEEVIDEVFDLLDASGANDEQLDFTTIYAIAREGKAKFSLEEENNNLEPIFNTILKDIPCPTGSDDADLQMQVFALDYDNYIGKIGIARVFNGHIKQGKNAFLIRENSQVSGKITKIFGFSGLKRIEADSCSTGQIVAIAGFEDLELGDTISDNKDSKMLEALVLENPTISVMFFINNSPFAGREGKNVTGSKLKDRLEKEMRTNVGMELEIIGDGRFKVFGKGELQIGILAENLRREDFEFSISRPEVVLKEENGKMLEPYEEVIADCPEEFSGSVIEKLGKRKANMTSMINLSAEITRMVFEMPTKNLIGYRTTFLTDTKGEGILNSSFLDYRAYVEEKKMRSGGALISNDKGPATGYSLFGIQDRGILFVSPGVELYQGMIIGEHAKSNDLDVNAIRGKQLTNVRSSGTDDAIKLTPAKNMSIENALEWIEDDELIEITPKSIRLRKKTLNPSERKRGSKAKK